MADDGLIEQVTEQVADQIVEVSEVTRRLTGREVGFFIAGASLGIAGGFAFGYLTGEKRLKAKYEKIAEKEISEMRRHYQEKMASKVPLEELVRERGYVPEEKEEQRRFSDKELQAIQEANAKYPADAQGDETVTVSKEVEERTEVNIFASEADWDYDLELSLRSSDVPYVIHVDEFQENEPDHVQITYTYYEVDDVLVDDLAGDQIEDMDEVIGLGNLGKWGHGSNDPNVVYIRNEELKIDGEIIRDRGSYADTVSRTIRHSSNHIDRGRRRRQRFDDD